MARVLTGLVVLAVLMSVLLPGCGPKPDADNAASPGPAPSGGTGDDGKMEGGAKGFVIGMSQCNLGEPWRVQMNEDIKAAAAEQPGVEVIYKDAQNKTEQQQAQVREFVTQGVDLIIISPKEAVPLTEPVAEAMQAGVPVIVLDRKIQGDNYTCFIGGDNVLIGREAGRYMVKLLGGKGKVVELKGLETSTPAGERHKGFMEGIKGSKIEIIFAADCQWLEPNAQKEMNSALSRFSQIDAVYGHNDPSAHGAYMAAKQEGKGREKTIRFIGIDALPHEGVKYVQDGILSATLQYPTGGSEAIMVAMKLRGGEAHPKTITLGTRLFTAENTAAGGLEIPPPPGTP
jgi:ribose transport system substrate-binding protein